MAKKKLPFIKTHCALPLLSRDLLKNPDGFFIEGTPRSGRCFTDEEKAQLSEEYIKTFEKRRFAWFRRVSNSTKKYGKKESSPCEEECYLYVTFYLNESEYSKNPLDLDNLLKPFMDGLKDGGLIKDDHLFCGIRVNRKLVGNGEKTGVTFRCVTTKTLKITKVEKGVEGWNFRDYWTDSMQLITAVDERNAPNAPGTFVDHMPGAILRDEKEREEQYRHIVPGYDWKEGETVSGCIVWKRHHHIKQEGHEEQHKQGASPLIWLQKWPD